MNFLRIYRLVSECGSELLSKVEVIIRAASAGAVASEEVWTELLGVHAPELWVSPTPEIQIDWKIVHRLVVALAWVRNRYIISSHSDS